MKTHVKIKTYRENACFGIVELADASGLPAGLISLYESGEIHNIPRRDLKAISEGLGIEAASLLNDRNEPDENWRSEIVDRRGFNIRLPREKYELYLIYYEHAIESLRNSGDSEELNKLLDNNPEKRAAYMWKLIDSGWEPWEEER